MSTWVHLETSRGARVKAPSFSSPPMIDGISVLLDAPVGVRVLESATSTDGAFGVPVLVLLEKYAVPPLPLAAPGDVRSDDQEIVIAVCEEGAGACAGGLRVLAHLALHALQHSRKARRTDGRDEQRAQADTTRVLLRRLLDSLCTLYPRTENVEGDVLEDDGLPRFCSPSAPDEDDAALPTRNRHFATHDTGDEAPTVAQTVSEWQARVECRMRFASVLPRAALSASVTARMISTLRAMRPSGVALFRRRVLLSILQKDAFPLSILYQPAGRSRGEQVADARSRRSSPAPAPPRPLLSPCCSASEKGVTGKGVAGGSGSSTAVGEAARRAADLAMASDSIAVLLNNVAQQLLARAFANFVTIHSQRALFTPHPTAPSGLPLVPFFCAFTPAGLLHASSALFFTLTSHDDRMLLAATAIDLLCRRGSEHHGDSHAEDADLKLRRLPRPEPQASQGEAQHDYWLVANALRVVELPFAPAAGGGLDLVCLAVGDALCFVFAFIQGIPSREGSAPSERVAGRAFATYLRGEVLDDTCGTPLGTWHPIFSLDSLDAEWVGRCGKATVPASTAGVGASPLVQSCFSSLHATASYRHALTEALQSYSYGGVIHPHAHVATASKRSGRAAGPKPKQRTGSARDHSAPCCPCGESDDVAPATSPPSRSTSHHKRSISPSLPETSSSAGSVSLDLCYVACRVIHEELFRIGSMLSVEKLHAAAVVSYALPHRSAQRSTRSLQGASRPADPGGAALSECHSSSAGALGNYCVHTYRTTLSAKRAFQLRDGLGPAGEMQPTPEAPQDGTTSDLGLDPTLLVPHSPLAAPWGSLVEPSSRSEKQNAGRKKSLKAARTRATHETEVELSACIESVTTVMPYAALMTPIPLIIAPANNAVGANANSGSPALPSPGTSCFSTVATAHEYGGELITVVYRIDAYSLHANPGAREDVTLESAYCLCGDEADRELEIMSGLRSASAAGWERNHRSTVHDTFSPLGTAISSILHNAYDSGSVPS